MRIILLVLVIFVCGAALSAEERTWTNQQGRTLQGEFVTTVGDTVYLRINGKLTRVKLEVLIQADQEYIAERRKKKDANSKKEPEELGEAAPEKSADLAPEKQDEAALGKPDESAPAAAANGELRIWHTPRGYPFEGRFAGFGDGLVVIDRGGLLLRIPYHDLNEDDRNYVKQVMETRGEANLLPSPGNATSATGRPGAMTSDDGSDATREAAPAEATDPETKANVAPSDLANAEDQSSRGNQPEPPNAPSLANMPMPNVGPSPTTASTDQPLSAPRVPRHEQELDAIDQQNMKAYYFLGGLLGVLFFLGPIAYSMQRFYS